MTTVQITRRTILGFGYTSACEQVWNKDQTHSSLQVCAVKEPDYTGTIKQLSETIEQDRTLKSFSGGTYYKTAWFVKVNGQWREIVSDYPHPIDLLGSTEDYRPWGTKYIRYHFDKINVEVK